MRGGAWIARLKPCATFRTHVAHGFSRAFEVAHGFSRVIVAALLCAAAIACTPAPGDLRKGDAPPAVSTPIGPVPGALDRVSRPSNPFAGDRAAGGDGRRLFTDFNCAGCHGDHAGGGMGPSLRDADWIYGNAEAQIFSSIAEGRAHGMPSWSTKLTEDQIWRLVTYIKALRTRSEPQPPV
jgi:cytochrome c oxidase cbb3-type subunit III